VYLKMQSLTYTSEWSLVLPGEEKVDLNLPEIGQASASVDNSIEDVDPRNNILYLANSPSVLATAARSLNMSLDEFGEPAIELIENSSIISFSIEGNSPEEAQSKAKALHQSIVKQIEFLKINKTEQETGEIRNTIQYEQKKLEELQNRLNQHKIDSDLISPEQIQVLSQKIENLRQQENQLEIDFQETNSLIQSFSNNLKLSPQEAQQALILQGDQLFQQYLQQYIKLSGNLLVLQSKFTSSSPVVIGEQEQLQEVETALLSRGNFVLGKPLEKGNLEKLNLKGSTENKDKESLARQLVSAYNNQQQIIAKKQVLAQQIQQLNSRLKYLAKEQLPINNLQRQADLAEALLTSKVGKFNLSADSSSAFPIVQLLSEPSLPDVDEPSGPDKKGPLLGTIAFAFLSATGLMLLYSDRNSPWKA
jgi:uncharacterized protein involved in exopolysaccharide biosynthesis